MKLVACYHVSVDYVADWDVTIPFEYSSIEQFIEDFGEWAKKNKDNFKWDNYFNNIGGLEADVYFEAGNFSAFEVLTLEDWWEKKINDYKGY